MTNAAFGVTIECNNCGNEFEREYEAGTRVTQDNSLDVREDKQKVQVRPQTDEFMDEQYAETCPVCDLDSALHVVERSPVDQQT